ncbi:serine/threonine-rich protein adg2-like isoform X2 [Penaeus japonicus]|uniref:serine/threonine-rich protein adg2-like isoform X2 n=1 Tax=Penaeus japonicus TaxID=27405 RepID=UPI001C7171F8|nr:serine/threonine-rich protein adg2-like isoform X2 [Penaeus japonicus]
MATKYSLLLLLLILIIAVHLSSGRRKKKQRCPKILRDNLVVRIRSAGWIAKLKCRRHFTMVEGDPNLTCVRNVWRGRIPKCITSGCESLAEVANGEKVFLYDDAMARFSCFPGYSLEGSPALSCDGINWNDTAPVCVGQQAEELSCDFEDTAMCGWTNDPKSDFQWTRSSGSAFQVGTAPRMDHTLDSSEGHFMYIDSSVRREESQKARLYSPVFSTDLASDGTACFSFYYHMYGHTTGSMNVYVKPEGRSVEHQAPMFQVNGFNSNQWYHEVFNINAMSENFQIVMEVVHSSGAMADVAVDDVRLARGDECFHLRQQVESRDDDTRTTTTTTTNTTTTTTTTTPATITTPTTTTPTTTTSTPPTTTNTPSIPTTLPTTTTASFPNTTIVTPTILTLPPTTANSTIAKVSPTEATSPATEPPTTTTKTTTLSTAGTEATVTPSGTPVTAGAPNTTLSSSRVTESVTNQTTEAPLHVTTFPAVVSKVSSTTVSTTTIETTTIETTTKAPTTLPPSSTTAVVITTPERVEVTTAPANDSEAMTSSSGTAATPGVEESSEPIPSSTTPTQPATKPPTTTPAASTTSPSPAPPSSTQKTSPSSNASLALSPATVASVSSDATDSSFSTATISLISFLVVAIVVAVAVAISIYVWRVRRQEKLPEDSEIRFLARDEVQMDGNIFSLGSTRPPRSTVA